MRRHEGQEDRLVPCQHPDDVGAQGVEVHVRAAQAWRVGCRGLLKAGRDSFSDAAIRILHEDWACSTLEISKREIGRALL